jgi:hypothetical protein
LHSDVSGGATRAHTRVVVVTDVGGGHTHNTRDRSACDQEGWAREKKVARKWFGPDANPRDQRRWRRRQAEDFPLFVVCCLDDSSHSTRFVQPTNRNVVLLNQSVTACGKEGCGSVFDSDGWTWRMVGGGGGKGFREGEGQMVDGNLESVRFRSSILFIPWQ